MDNIKRIESVNRDVSSSTPAAKQDCADVVNISIFFDGTGNNKEADEKTEKWANPARLWFNANTYAMDARKVGNSNNYAVYVSGVGTAFNGKALNIADAQLIKVQDSAVGMGTGTGGTRRLNFGQQQINDSLKDALLKSAKAKKIETDKYNKSGKAQSFAKVNRHLGEHRLIKMINVSIFGFSRGGALARAFCNEWLWECSTTRGQLTYEGYPIRFHFMGIFDTVASFGLAATNTSNITSYKGRDMQVDARVEQCVHYVAGNELRFAFPVDLIRTNKKYKRSNWIEKVYPGMHSDVGGGYAPDEQKISNNLARIPMRDMMQKAWKAGVRLYNYDELRKNEKIATSFQDRFHVEPETERLFQAYQRACPMTGTLEAQVKACMALYYSAYGTLHRKGLRTVSQTVRAEGNFWKKYIGPDDMATEIQRYQQTLNKLTHPQSLMEAITKGVQFTAYLGINMMAISPEPWQLEAWNKNVSDEVAEFYLKYIHDSKVDFLSNLEPFSYFSKRGMSESMHSIQGWTEENILLPADKMIEQTTDKVVDTYHKVETKAIQTYDTTKKAAIKTYDATEKAVVKAYDKTQKVAKETYTATKENVGQAYETTSHYAKDKVSQAGELLDNMGQKAGKAAEALWPF